MSDVDATIREILDAHGRLPTSAESDALLVKSTFESIAALRGALTSLGVTPSPD